MDTRISLDGYLYPLIALAIRANLGVILPVAVMFTLVAAYCRVQIAVTADLDFSLVTYSLLEFAALLLCDLYIMLAVYPYLLSGGTERGWTSVRRTRGLTVTLYITASIGIFVVIAVLAGIIGAALTLVLPATDALPTEGMALAGIAVCAVLTLALFGLAFPQIMSTNRLALTQVAMWGVRKLPRLLMLLGAGFLPLTLAATSLGLWSEDRQLHVAALADWPSINWGPMGIVLVESLLTFVASIAGAVALCKVYREVAPLDHYSPPDVYGEVFD